MLPCAYKQLFGISCPLCGFQRYVLCLIDGDVIGSIKMFPPLLFLILTTIISCICYLRKKRSKIKIVKILWIGLLCLLIANAFYQNLNIVF